MALSFAFLHLEFADGADRFGTVWKEPQAEPAAGEDGLINLSRDSLCGLSLFFCIMPPASSGGTGKLIAMSPNV